MAFIIEHDWDAAFAGATDFDFGECPPPYDLTVFELVVSGYPTCVFCRKDSPLIGAIYFKDVWLAGVSIGDEFLARQTRAACIALDSEVATHEVRRAPAKLNRARVKRGKPPLTDYNVVRLANRKRAIPLDEHSAEGSKRRLHFVRGHWRRYANHKTWIKWYLRGDPDLGHIEKHYRL